MAGKQADKLLPCPQESGIIRALSINRWVRFRLRCDAYNRQCRDPDRHEFRAGPCARVARQDHVKTVVAGLAPLILGRANPRCHLYVIELLGLPFLRSMIPALLLLLGL